MSMDIVFKEGKLFLLGVKFGKRTWRKIWITLYKPSSRGVGRLEISNVTDTSAVNDQKKGSRQKTERKVVRLSDCLSVTPAQNESCPQGCSAFYLNTTHCTFTLASPTSQEWMSALCLLAFQKDPGGSGKGVMERENDLTMEDNDLYSSWTTDVVIPPNQYQVTVLSTEASRRCKLAGEYLVSPEKEAVILLTVRTGHIIYSWPYKLLRKFGQVEIRSASCPNRMDFCTPKPSEMLAFELNSSNTLEDLSSLLPRGHKGGFSIEAGRRCKSGEGVFIFLSTHGPLIFQTISQCCSVKRRSSDQPLSVNRRSTCDQFAIIPQSTTNQPDSPPIYNMLEVCAVTQDQSDIHSNVTEASVQDLMQPPLVNSHFSNSRETLEEESENDGICHSLGALKLDNDIEGNIYCNFMRATPIDDLGIIYSDVKKNHSASDSQLQPFSSPLPQPDLQPPSCTFSEYAPHKPKKQPPVNNDIQLEYNAQTQAVDDMKKMEESISSTTHVTPTEPLSSFKHRLAEIISKDLAKFQPPPPSGMGNPTFSQ